MAPEPGEARQQVLELGEFDLQLALLRAGALGENIQNQRRAVEHLAIEDAFEIAALGGGKLVVENDGIDLLAPAMPGKFAGFAAADEGAGDRSIEFLGAVAHDFTAGGGGQFGKLVKGITGAERAAGFEFNANEEDSFSPAGRGRD